MFVRGAAGLIAADEQFAVVEMSLVGLTEASMLLMLLSINAESWDFGRRRCCGGGDVPFAGLADVWHSRLGATDGQTCKLPNTASNC